MKIRARSCFQTTAFGREWSALQTELDAEMNKVKIFTLSIFVILSCSIFAKSVDWCDNKNHRVSLERCGECFSDCSDEIERLNDMRLPSLGKFNAGMVSCNRTCEVNCIGPAKLKNSLLLVKLFERSSAQFLRRYNQQLLLGFSMGSICGIVVFRFVVPVSILELVCWLAFFICEMFPKVIMVCNFKFSSLCFALSIDVNLPGFVV